MLSRDDVDHSELVFFAMLDQGPGALLEKVIQPLQIFPRERNIGL